MKQIIKNSATSKIDNRLSYTSERYKGYLIVLDRGGDGYNVYDRHRELEDAGYPSKAAAKNFIDELVANDDIYSSSDFGQIDWRKLDWDEQIQLMKKYIKQYKGAKIFEDFAEYIGEPVEDIIDSFVDAESHRELRIPERMQLDSEYRNDDIYSSNVKASEDDYNPYSFMVGDQLEWSGLYGGQYKGLVTNVNDEYVTVEVMRTAEDSGDTIIDTQKFEIVTDPEGKECIIVWTYGSHAGYVYPPYEDDPDDYDDSIYSSESSNVNNMKYWYFTKHGVQPGSIPKYVNVLDIIDKPEGSYFLTDTIINTNDLHEYEIKEAIPEDVDSCSEIEANYNVAIDKLHNELYNKIVKYGLSEGFLENEIDDYFFVTVMKAYDHIECEVRAEVDYEGLEALCDLLNPVVQKYEPAAYFEPVTSGIIEAYIYPTGKNKALFASKGSSDTHYMQLKRAYKNMRKFDDMDSQSADILDLEDELNSHDTPYERYEHTTDNGCTIFYDDYIKGQEFKNSDLTERETLYYKGKKFVVHYTVKDTYDAKEAFDSFKASISMIAPYDDADYYWARIYNGIIKYIYKGKVMRVNYYFNPEDMSDVDDWNLEDWYSGICDEVVQSLYEANKSIESRMVHN